MKKVLLATWINYDNFGTLLQAYCLKEILENLNDFIELKDYDALHVECLNYLKQDTNSSRLRINKILNRSFVDNLHKLYSRVTSRIYLFHNKKLFDVQKRQYDIFRSDKLNCYPKQTVYNEKDMCKLNDFDLYVVGSDQVWNPEFKDWIFLLGWVSKGKDKISYAPSICVDKIPQNIIGQYNCLSDFKAISVREYTGAAKQIEGNIDKKIEEVVDPVILFGRNKLLEICEGQEGNNACFINLLGSDMNNRKYALEFSKNSDLTPRAVTTMDAEIEKNDRYLKSDRIWNLGPLDFVREIYGAKVVVTDSFHCMIICLLLHKKFVILGRENDGRQQNNRLLRILKMVKLEKIFDRRPKNKDDIEDIEWGKIDKIIEQRRGESLSYLKKALRKCL